MSLVSRQGFYLDTRAAKSSFLVGTDTISPVRTSSSPRTSASGISFRGGSVLFDFFGDISKMRKKRVLENVAYMSNFQPMISDLRPFRGTSNHVLVL